MEGKRDEEDVVRVKGEQSGWELAMLEGCEMVAGEA